MKSFFVVLTVWISSTVFSQNYNEREKMNLIQKKGIEITKSDLNNLNDYDFDLIKNYNFDLYRFLNLEKSIKLVNGPLIKLLPIRKMESMGITYSNEVLENTSKKNENFKHDLILQLNIGLGVSNAENLE
jgi:hypothetical protein